MSSSPRPPIGLRLAAIGWWLPVLGLVTLALYQPAWHGGVLWDDDAHLTAPALRSAAGLWRIWSDVTATQQYYPVVHSAFWLMHRLWGDATTGYHFVNILIHAGSAFLFLLVLRALRVPGAGLAALIFAVHPVQVESVAWITELKNTLSGLFYFSAALAYLSFDRGRAPRRYALALGLFGLALGSKTVTATLPAALLVVFWWQRGRVDWRRDVRPLLPFFAAGTGAGLFTAWVERALIGARGAEFDLTIVERVLLAGRVVWFYVGKIVWPRELIFIYPRWQVSQGEAWQYAYPIAAVAVVAGLASLAWRHRERGTVWRAPLAIALLFIGTLFPALGFFNVYPFRYSFVADHFQYLACAAIFAGVAAGVASLVARAARARAAVIWPVCVVAVCAPLAVVTWRQAHHYTDAETLYRTTIGQNPSCWMCFNNLGELQVRASVANVGAAVASFREALRLNPGNAEAHNNLGYALQAQGRAAESVAELETALRLRPEFPEAINNLGVAMQMLGRPDEARSRFVDAIRLRPDYAEAHYNLASHFLGQGQPEAGQAEARAALAINPDYADARGVLARTLQALGRADEAIAEYRDLLRRRPGSVEAHNNLGTALETLRRYPEAEAEYLEALRLQPDAVLALTNLGRVLLAMHRDGEGITRLEQAVRLQPDAAGAQYLLASALRESGQLEQAIPHYRQALESAPEAALPEIHNDLAIALAGVGKQQDAIAHFREAVRLKPDFAAARANLDRALGKGR